MNYSDIEQLLKERTALKATREHLQNAVSTLLNVSTAAPSRAILRDRITVININLDNIKATIDEWHDGNRTNLDEKEA